MAANNQDDLKEAAEAAELLAQNAEAAALSASGDADTAVAAAEQTRAIADQLGILASASPISDIVFLLTIFALAIFVGYYVVWSVTPALHTPLMSVTNAISSVVIVGALIALGADLSEAPNSFWPKAFGFLAVVLASVNIFGGFLVTQRMLAMYKKKER